MALIKPFSAHLASTKDIDKIVAPPYDVVSREQAASLARDKSCNILHVSRPDIDFASDIAADDSRVYRQGQINLQHFIKLGYFTPDAGNNYYIYQISNSTHCQTGLVCMIDEAAYSDGRLKKHEQIHHHKVADRLALTKTLQAQISPVLLTYRNQETLKQRLASIWQHELAHFDITYNDDNRHRLWLIKSPEILTEIQALVDGIDTLYIADGHHRCATLASLSEQSSTRQFPGILSVIFPQEELNILGYHRIIHDVTAEIASNLLSRLDKHFVLQAEEQPVVSHDKGVFGLFFEGQWYSLTIKKALLSNSSLPILDGELFHQYIVEPIFNIHDQRSSKQISFVGGNDSSALIEATVTQQASSIGFTLPPTRIEDILDVSDIDQCLPPKSTWFEPKLLDGFFIQQ